MTVGEEKREGKEKGSENAGGSGGERKRETEKKGTEKKKNAKIVPPREYILKERCSTTRRVGTHRRPIIINTTVIIIDVPFFYVCMCVLTIWALCQVYICISTLHITLRNKDAGVNRDRDGVV